MKKKHAVFLAAIILTALAAQVQAQDDFPAERGDRWTYQTPTGETTVRVRYASGPYWRYFSEFLGAPRWVAFAYDTVWVWDAPRRRVVPVFRFDRLTRSQWQFTLSGAPHLTNVRVTALGRSQRARSARSDFTGCIAFRLESGSGTSAWNTTISFAPGVGLVRGEVAPGRLFEISAARVQRGHSSPVFGRPVTYPLPTGNLRPRMLAVGDVDADGSRDVVVYADDTWSSQVVVLKNDGSGRLDGTGQGPGASQAERGLALADMDRDGHLDAITVQPASGGASVWPPMGGQVSIYRGDGTGRLQAPRYPQGTPSGAAKAGHLRAADLDADGVLDLVTVSGGGTITAGYAEVVTLIANSAGAPLTQSTSLPVTYVDGIAVGDLNGDAFPDLVILTRTHLAQSSKAMLYVGDGLGGFSLQRERPYGGSVQQLTAATLGDVSGDGRHDLVMTQDHPGFPTVGANPITNDAQVNVGWAANLPLNDWIRQVELADLNGSGLLDIVTFSQNGFSTVINDRPWTRYPFRGRWTTPVPNVRSGAQQGAVADLNGDGRPDVILATSGGVTVYYSSN